MTELKAGEGVVNINGDLTPISHEPVYKVNSAEWTNISLRKLLEQRDVLNQRLAYAHQCYNPTVIAALQRGIAQINAILESQYNYTNNINSTLLI